jgi:energy coupling factor transporter S component ThiW
LKGAKKMKTSSSTLKLVFISMMVAIGVVISPLLRIEGMCPTAHLINIVCAVFMGPWYALLNATLIGIIRMLFLGIPPLALTGAVFGATLSGLLYRASKGNLLFAVVGEVIGTGIIGSIVSYPIMKFLVGKGSLSLFFYTPMFLTATLMGGSVAYLFLITLKKNGMLQKIQNSLGTKI